MKKNQLINKRGEVVGLIDENDIVPDGFGIRTSISLMDSEDESSRLTDAWGNAAGHRPGYVYGPRQAHDARETYKARLQDAWRTKVADNDPAWPAEWRGPGPYAKPEDHTVETDAAREAYIARVSDAWRTGQALWDRPAREAWGVGPWRDKNPSPKPPDVAMDSAPNTDAAWKALVQRTTNAWRTTGGAR